MSEIIKPAKLGPCAFLQEEPFKLSIPLLMLVNTVWLSTVSIGAANSDTLV